MNRVVSRCSWVVLTIAVNALPSCYHYRVAAPQVANLNEPASVTKWSLFWGLAQSAEEDTSCRCMNGGLKEVTASTNYGYLLIGVVSLGTVVPAELEYVCGKPPPGAPWPTPPSADQCKNVPPNTSASSTPVAPTNPAPSASTPLLNNTPDEGSF
jgi:hypothetical protein